MLADELVRWLAVEHNIRRHARLYGYEEIRTPIIEEASLFLRSIGETSDIVQKEMFQFEDRGGHAIVLRPEGTAAVVRAYLEHSLHKTQGFSKLFYLGPMFRAERPQAGRFRQFHQFGVEAIGSASPWVDVEAITLSDRILEACGITKRIVWLSSMGCRPDQNRSAEALRKRLLPDREKLCQECQKRFDKNIFRVLDCKNPACRQIAWNFKDSPFLLCEDCKNHFDAVRHGLKQAGVSFDDSKTFARGLDYYTQTVFEVRAEGLGAQDAVCAGGRYNHLVEELGGPAMGAFGFAAGIERILMAQSENQKPPNEPSQRKGLYVALAQPQLMERGFGMVLSLRKAGVQTFVDYDGKSLKAQLREADQAGCRFVAVIGEKEFESGSVTVKELSPRSNQRQEGQQHTFGLKSFVKEMSELAKQNSCH